MFQASKPIFQFRGPLGIPVEIHGTLLLLALIFVGLDGLSTEALFYGFVTFGMVVLSIFLHELGHAWGAWIQGVPVSRIVLHGGGGFCQHRSTGAYEAEFIVIMGPLVNLGLWAVSSLMGWWILTVQLGASGLIATQPAAIEFWIQTYAYLEVFGWINLVLFGLNLVPVQPLDGGRLLHLALLRQVPGPLALRIAGGVGVICAILWLPAMLVLYFNMGWMLLFFPSLFVHWDMLRGKVPI